MSKRKPALFLDRDGVLCNLVGVNRERGPRAIGELSLIEGAVDCVKFFSNRGYLCLVASNQPDISRGKMSEKTLNSINREINRHIPEIKQFYVCPHDNLDGCFCRKPSPGLLLDGIRDFNISVGESMFVGDSWTDVLAARNAGLFSVLIEGTNSWKSTSQGSPPKNLVPDLTVNSITQIQALLSR